MPSTATTAREYQRVSADKSGRERSPEEQHYDNAIAAARHGWQLHGESYRDIGSASRYAKKALAGFDRLCADLAADRFGAQVLMMWESSRGSRKVSEWVRLIELCEERGVRIHVTSDGRTYDPADARDRRSLLEDSVDAEYESAKTSKRAKRAAAATARDGRPSGRIPFGYRRRYDPVTRKLVAQEEEPDEAKVVRELFDRLHKGHSLRSIAADFEQRGIRTRTGLVFSPQHLRSVALNPAYSGQRVHDPGRTNGGHKLSPNARFTKGQWPELVDRSRFLAVQRRLTAPERVTTRPGRGVHLLSMIARCDVCSAPLAAVSIADRGREYTCHHKRCVRVSYDDLNDYAEEAMLDLLSRPDHVARLLAADDGGEALRAARSDVETIRAELDDLADQVGQGKLSAALAARAEPGILSRLRVAEQREAELSTPSELSGLIAPGEGVVRRWRDAPMSTRREVARRLLSPMVLGELRVTRSPIRGRRCPVEDRVALRRLAD